MRIGCLQFAPQVGDTENNLNRADSVLSKANREDLDLLVLPELAFSGTLHWDMKSFASHLSSDTGLLGADFVQATILDRSRISRHFLSRRAPV